ncbi:MAG: GIY-YIG nuclease family protein [Candidatus Taylorbacteria bacterium]|nr:GIY-YIG nuclease family protein [Candidatus Taylorbacteria bacterium]
MPYFVYIVECFDNTLYCGSTNDLEKRVSNHNSKKSGARYTRSRQPVVLKYFEKFETKSEAMKREYVIKQLSRQKKIALLDKLI